MKKKFLALLLTFTMVLGLAACGGGSGGQTPNGDTQSGGGQQQTDAQQPSGGETAGSAGKIAVIRNMENSDHTAQFFQGCIDEGEALGYTVDTFMSNQDDVVMQDLMEQALSKDYDIWIVSHANEGYQYEVISKAVEKGIKVVGFDCGGEHVPGVTYTSPNDIALSQLSLDAMIEGVEAAGGQQPVKFAEINILGLIVPFDTRHGVIEEYMAGGKLDCVEIISPNLGGDTYSQIYTATTTVLNKNEGKIGLWAASSGFLDGAVDAINDAGRQDDVTITAVDISNTELARMVSAPNYYACAAVDPYVIGMVDVRLAVLKVLGVETPETYALEPVNIYGSQITDSDDMSNLDQKFDDFGSTEAFNTDEIKAERDKYAK